MKAFWTVLTKRRLRELVGFLAPVEWSCVAFTEKLIGQRGPHVPDSDHKAIVRQRSDGRIDGAILQSPGGFCFPVLDPAARIVEDSAVSLLRRTSQRLFSLMGVTSDVLALEAAFTRTPLQELEYHLMVQNEPLQERPYRRVPNRMTIRLATEEDTDYLFDIQKKYEIEEVLLEGNRFSAAATMRHLQETLQTQVTYLAEIDGRPIAKAGTNARGFFYDQIGGVFTVKRLRSLGVGSQLMTRLLAHLAEEKKSGTLFVKKDNNAALHMYRGLGFGVQESFRISYFR